MQFLLYSTVHTQSTANSKEYKYEHSELEGECTIRSIYPVRFNPPKFCLFIIGCLLTLGILLLLSYWHPHIR